jgi:hypothetical protein
MTADSPPDDASSQSGSSKHRVSDWRQRKKEGRSLMYPVVDDVRFACRSHGLHERFDLAKEDELALAFDEFLRMIRREVCSDLADNPEVRREILMDVMRWSRRG